MGRLRNAAFGTALLGGAFLAEMAYGQTIDNGHDKMAQTCYSSYDTEKAQACAQDLDEGNKTLLWFLEAATLIGAISCGAAAVNEVKEPGQ